MEVRQDLAEAELEAGIPYTSSSHESTAGRWC